jgi:hypothetical protein
LIDEKSDEATWFRSKSGRAAMSLWSGWNSPLDPIPSIRDMLGERFELTAADIYDVPEDLDYTPLFQLAGMPLPALRDPASNPLAPAAIENSHDVFAAIRAGVFWCTIPAIALSTASNTSLLPRLAIRRPWP